MEEKSEMELLYEQYLVRDDKILVCNDDKFYRIISKSRISKGGTVVVTLPSEMLSAVTSNCKVKDENGRTFETGKIIHLSFKRVPKWYMRSFTIPINGINNTKDIGDYLAWSIE